MKNKFALCFRPAGIETEEADDDHKKQVKHHSTSIIVAKDQHRSKMISPVIPHHIPQSSRKILSRVLKVILLQPSPPLRAGDGNIPELTFVPKHNDWSKSNNQSNKIVPSISSPNSSPSSTNSTTASTSTSITSRVSFSSESKEMKALSLKRSLARSRSNSLDRKKKAKTTSTNVNKTPKSSSTLCEDLVFYLIVLALLATIFWGKLYAILVTSMWLYFAPNRNIVFYGSPENAVESPEMETSKEHKKRVIMEGLLERKPIQRALNF